MGSVYASIKLSNPQADELKPMEVSCLVDTGATHLIIPAAVCFQLGLKEHEKREVILADGSVKLVPYVGPVKIFFENRSCLTGALVMGEQTLLGVIPMEDMDIIVHPGLFKLTVNPARPNIAGGLAMGLPKSERLTGNGDWVK
jgi:clan AA aspartic protease